MFLIRPGNTGSFSETAVGILLKGAFFCGSGPIECKIFLEIKILKKLLTTNDS